MIDLQGLKYHVMPAKVAGKTELISIYNEAYTFWKTIWSEALTHMKLPPLDKDQFLRQDYICFLTFNDKIVGSHLYSVFDVRTHLAMECSYFAPAAAEIKDYCHKNNISTMMTQEYLAVAPEMRKSAVGSSLPELLIALGVKVMEAVGCDSTLGTVRAGAPSVERISKEMNGDLLNSTVYRYEIPHKIFIAPKDRIKMPGNDLTKAAINKLWNEKNDYIGLNKGDRNDRANVKKVA